MDDTEPAPTAVTERLPDYRRVVAAYVAAMAAATAAGRRSVPAARRPGDTWSDVALVALATFKVSRLVAKQTVTAAVRAPFAVDVGPGGTGERTSRPRGDGLRRSIGELVTCPFCLDVWVGSVGTVALAHAPRAAGPLLATFAAVGLADLCQFAYVTAERHATG